jgi:hypothetical protein
LLFNEGQEKNMMKIFKSLAIITAVVAIAGGGTYAWQLQQETISGITYSADSMDLQIDGNPSPDGETWVDSFDAPAAFDKNGLKPGSFGEQIIDIKGAKDAEASIKITADFNKENTLISPEVEVGDTMNGNVWDGELAQNMRVKISYQADNAESFVQLYDRTVYEYITDTNLLDLGAITSTTGIASVKLEWSIPEGAGNEIMTDQLGMNVVFGLK